MYVYGFVHPQTGRTEWWLLGGVNTPAMSAVLAEFAALVGAGKHKRVLLVLDRAGWPVAKDLVIPEGIPLVHLPASTPELQPAERLWPPRREAVANESFADLAALDAKLSERCGQLSAQRAFIAGCTHYHWWPQTWSNAIIPAVVSDQFSGLRLHRCLLHPSGVRRAVWNPGVTTPG